MCGIRLDYDNYKSKWAGADNEEGYGRLEPYMDSAFEGIKHKDGMCCIYDGMCGEYIFIGRVLAKTKDHEFFEGEMEVDFLTELEKELLLQVIKTIVETDQTECKYYLIGHYR